MMSSQILSNTLGWGLGLKLRADLSTTQFTVRLLLKDSRSAFATGASSMNCIVNKTIGVNAVKLNPKLGQRNYSSATSVFNTNNNASASKIITNYNVSKRGISSMVEPVDIASKTANQVNAAVIDPYIGELAAHNLGVGWTSLSQHCMEYVTVYTGLPWYLSIVASVVTLRLVTFPLSLYGQVNAAKMNKIKPQMDKLQAEMASLYKKNDHKGASDVKSKISLLFKRKGIRPYWGMALPLIQFPVFMSFFFALRKMLEVPVPSMTTGGILWFTDLSLSDPTFVLPIIAGASSLASFELTLRSGTVPDMMKDYTNTFRGVIVGSIVFTSQFPAGTLVYFFASTCVIALQGILFRNTLFRRYNRLPSLESQKKMAGKALKKWARK